MTILENVAIPSDSPATSAEREQRRHLGRTRERQAAKRFRAELVAHVGGNPSVTQQAIIERIVQLQLHLSVMDRRFASDHTMSAHDSKVYLAWAGALARLLKQLGLQAGKPPARTLADHLAEKAATARASASPVAPAVVARLTTTPTPDATQRHASFPGEAAN